MSKNKVVQHYTREEQNVLRRYLHVDDLQDSMRIVLASAGLVFLLQTGMTIPSTDFVILKSAVEKAAQNI